MALDRRRLVIGALLLVLALAAVRALAGGSDSGGFAPGYAPPSDGYFEQGPGGYIGSDGSSSYYFDPSTGCTVLDGSVSC
jgi:hypothetical protein